MAKLTEKERVANIEKHHNELQALTVKAAKLVRKLEKLEASVELEIDQDDIEAPVFTTSYFSGNKQHILPFNEIWYSE